MEAKQGFILYFTLSRLRIPNYTEFYRESIYFTNFSKHACTRGARIKQFYLLERYETRNANV